MHNNLLRDVLAEIGVEVQLCLTFPKTDRSRTTFFESLGQCGEIK